MQTNKLDNLQALSTTELTKQLKFYAKTASKKNFRGVTSFSQLKDLMNQRGAAEQMKRHIVKVLAGRNVKTV